MAAHRVNSLDLLGALQSKKKRGLKKTKTVIKKLPLQNVVLTMDNPDPPDCILPGLYLGSHKNALSPGTISTLGVTHILNVAGERTLPPDQISRLSGEYLHLPLNYNCWNADMKAHAETVYNRAFSFISEALKAHIKNPTKQDIGDNAEFNGDVILEKSSPKVTACDSESKSEPGQRIREGSPTVLVHCARGRSRSAAIVIGYLMRHRGMNLVQAYSHTKRCRPYVGPHYPLRTQLITLEKKWLGCSSLTMADWVVLGNSNQWWDEDQDENKNDKPISSADHQTKMETRQRIDRTIELEEERETREERASASRQCHLSASSDS